MAKGFSYKGAELFAEDVALEKIARAVGTPCYVYASSQLEQNYLEFQAAFAGQTVTICYAAKANSSLAVLKTLARLGAGADIVSAGELKRALAAGIPARKIVFSGVGKTQDEIKAALEADILQINVESWPEVELVSAVAVSLGKKAPVAFRVNPDVDARTHAKISTGKKDNKFGIDIARAPMFYLNAAKLPGIELTGIAVHIGSQLTDLAPFAQAFSAVAKLCRDIEASGIELRRIDLGGGLGITYKDEVAPDINGYAKIIRETIAPLGKDIIIEPGRRIAGNAGVLLSKVLYVKEGGARKYLILDAAMNDLARPSLYDAYHPVWPCVQSQDGARETYDIVGPVCETGDTFHVDEPLQKLKSGDTVALMASGAYGAVMSSTYNTRPLAPEVMVKGLKFFVSRPREDIDSLLAREQMPDWLED